MKRFAVLALIFAVCPTILLAGPNLLPNSGMESADARNRLQALGWNKYGNGYVRVVDPSNAYEGSCYISITQTGKPTQNAGAWRRIYLNQRIARPVSVTAVVTGRGIVNSSADKFGASLYAEIHLMNGEVIYSKNTNRTKNTGTFNRRKIGWNTASIGIDKPIYYIDVFPMMGKITGTAYFDAVEVRVFDADRGRPAVTIMFDDGYKSVKTIARPELSKYGWRGTVAPFVTGVRSNSSTYLTLKELQELKNRYCWTVASHGMDHRDIPPLSRAQMEAELFNSTAYFNGNGLDVFHFIWPFGDYSQDAWDVARWYYISARNVERFDNPYGLVPWDVRIQEVEYNTTSAQVSSWLYHAKANNRWLILLFHDISDTAGPRNIYSVKPSLFRGVLSQVKASCIRVMTYDSAYAEYAFDPR